MWVLLAQSHNKKSTNYTEYLRLTKREGKEWIKECNVCVRIKHIETEGKKVSFNDSL